MKLPIKRDSAAELTAVEQRLAADEAAIADAQREHELKLPDADDSELVAIEDKITALEKAAARHRSKIAVLQARLTNEQAAQHEADYQQAVEKISAVLPRRTKAAGDIERALANLAGAVKEFMLATENVLKAWPEMVEWPNRVFAGHALSLERLGALVQEIFEPARSFADKRAPTPGDYLRRAANADHHRAWAAEERRHAEEFISDLKTAHDPPPVETQITEEEAA